MRTLALSILFTVLFSTAINAQSRDLHELGIKGYKLVLDMQYEDGNKIFDEIIRREPENALGYFLKALSYESMLDISPNDKELQERFKDISFKGVKVAEEMLKQNKDDIDALFYQGSLYGNIGMYYVKNKSWLRAYWYGHKAKNIITQVIEKNHEYYDAYLGIGIYHYAADALPKIVKALSFLFGGVEGDSKKGIDEITLASLKGRYTKDKAKLMLADVIYYGIEDNYEAATPLFEELAAKYPQNHYIKMRLAICYRKLGKYALSVQTIKPSLQSNDISKYKHLYGELYYTQGLAFSLMNEYEQAILAYKNAYKISQLIKGNKPYYFSWSLFRIGDSYAKLGSADKAREYFSKIKKKDDKSAYIEAQKRIKNL